MGGGSVNHSLGKSPFADQQRLSCERSKHFYIGIVSDYH